MFWNWKVKLLKCPVFASSWIIWGILSNHSLSLAWPPTILCGLSFAGPFPEHVSVCLVSAKAFILLSLNGSKFASHANSPAARVTLTVNGWHTIYTHLFLGSNLLLGYVEKIILLDFIFHISLFLLFIFFKQFLKIFWQIFLVLCLWQERVLAYLFSQAFLIMILSTVSVDG